MIWIIRTLVEYRRWHRTSKVHTEVHNKLLDRFTTNEDLMAYIQTPAGRRFLESAPLSVEDPARPMGAPFSRILWSVQVGIVLAAGAARLALREQPRAATKSPSRFYAFGVLALMVGVGLRGLGRRVNPPVAAARTLRSACRPRATTPIAAAGS